MEKFTQLEPGDNNLYHVFENILKWCHMKRQHSTTSLVVDDEMIWNRDKFNIEFECRYGVQKEQCSYVSGLKETSWRSLNNFIRTRLVNHSPTVTDSVDISCQYKGRTYRVTLDADTGVIVDVMEKTKVCSVVQKWSNHVNLNRRTLLDRRFSFCTENSQYLVDDGLKNTNDHPTELLSEFYKQFSDPCNPKYRLDYNWDNKCQIRLVYLGDRSVMMAEDERITINTIRKKHRYTYDLDKNNDIFLATTTTDDISYPFLIDLTVVRFELVENHPFESFTVHNSIGRIHYECEVEMKEFVDEFVREQLDHFIEHQRLKEDGHWFHYIGHFDGFTHSLNKFISKSLMNPFLDIGLEHNPSVHPMDIFRRVHVFENQSIKSSLPVAFGWENYKTVHSGDYFVAEKSDGVRYLLYIERDGSYKFFSRGLTEYFEMKRGYIKLWTIELNDPQHVQIGEYFDLEYGPYLLDGEMTRTIKDDQPLYIIFDVLCMNGISLMEMTLMERLSSLVGKFYPLSTTEHQKLSTDFGNPLWLMALKTFYYLDNWDKLKKRIKGKDQSFYDPHPSCRLNIATTDMPQVDVFRSTKIDGLIFTPNSPYQMGTTPTLFKWKYPHMLTIDCHIKRERNPLANGFPPMEDNEYAYDLFAADRQGDLLQSRRIIVRREDHLILMADEELHSRIHHGQGRFIGEFSFDLKHGWVYNQPRFDKINANVVDVVMETMERIIQNIQEKDLIKMYPSS